MGVSLEREFPKVKLCSLWNCEYRIRRALRVLSFLRSEKQILLRFSKQGLSKICFVGLCILCTVS